MTKIIFLHKHSLTPDDSKAFKFAQNNVVLHALRYIALTKTVIFSFLYLWPLVFYSQIQTLPFDYLSLGSGQDINFAYHINQDKNGFMWFGTLNGLVRYDGTNLKRYNYDEQDSTKLKGKRVDFTLEDRFGNLWVLSRASNGFALQALDVKRNKFYTVSLPVHDPPCYQPNSKYAELMLEEKGGTIWIRSNCGLFRMEPAKNPRDAKISLYQYESENEFSLSDDKVQVLLMDSRQNLWIGTDKGLDFYDRVNDKIIRCFSTTDAKVISLLELPDSRILCGTRGDGLYLFDPKTKTVEHIQPDNQNTSGLGGESIHQLAIDGKKNIWLFAGSYSSNIFTLQRFDPVTGQFDTPFVPWSQKGLLSNMGGIAFSLYTDRNGFLWVNTGTTLKRYDPYREVFSDLVEMNPTIEDWSVLYHYFEDQTGVLWMGTLSKGVVKYASSRHKFRVIDYIPESSTKKHNIRFGGISEDNKGYLWMPTDNGTGQFEIDENDQLTLLKEFPAINSKVVEGSKGDYWISSINGLYHYEPEIEKISHYVQDETNEKSLSNNIIPSILMLDENHLLVNTYGGGLNLLDINADTFQHYYHNPKDSNSLQTNFLISIIRDYKNRIWVGSAYGIHLFEPKSGKFTSYLPDISTRKMHVDQEGTMWITTSGMGFHRLNPETGIKKRYDTGNGAPTIRFSGILEDDHGGLWISSDVGIVYFNPENESFRTYDESHGLPTRDLPISAPCKRKNGELIFRSDYKRGSVLFHPDSLRNDPFEPKAAIVDFLLMNKPVEAEGKDSLLHKAIWETDHLVLKHDQNVFTLIFSAFHYASPENNKFQFKLEGIDGDWIDAGNQRSARYAGLSPGKYTFKVKAANHDGLWGKTTILNVSILPPWWASWGAYLLYLLIFAIGAYSFYLYKKRQWELQAQLNMEHQESERLKELDTLKTKLYTNITHEFRTPLTIILGMARQIKHNPKNWYAEGLEMIERNGRQLLRLVNQMLNLSKLESGVLPIHMIQGDVIAFLKYVLESFHSLAENKNIELQFRSKEEAIVMDYDPEKLQEIISNLLSNAIKFTTRNGGIQLIANRTFIKRKDNLGFQNLPTLQITVKDNGVGIAPEKLPYIFDRFFQADDETTRHGEGTGIGLALTRELVKLLGGKISVKSNSDSHHEEKGTEFTIQLPISNKAVLTNGEEQSVSVEREKSFPITAIPSKPAFESDEIPILLIVEDNLDVIKYLQSILEDDYCLEMAFNGRDGIEKAIEMIPDIILSDVMMPEADGFELCETLKKDQRTSHIPIILLTAKSDAHSRIEGLECGADAYLAKPFDQEELLVRIRKMLELRRHLRAHFSSYFWYKPAPGKSFKTEDVFLKKLQEVLEMNYSEELFNIPQLCETLHMSRAQLYRKVKALTGKSVGHLLRSFRMNKAKSLLETTDLPVSQVSLDVGFKYLAHFSRSFQQEFGENPSEIRK